MKDNIGVNKSTKSVDYLEHDPLDNKNALSKHQLIYYISVVYNGKYTDANNHLNTSFISESNKNYYNTSKNDDENIIGFLIGQKNQTLDNIRSEINLQLDEEIYDNVFICYDTKKEGKENTQKLNKHANFRFTLNNTIKNSVNRSIVKCKISKRQETMLIATELYETKERNSDTQIPFYQKSEKEKASLEPLTSKHLLMDYCVIPIEIKCICTIIKEENDERDNIKRNVRESSTDKSAVVAAAQAMSIRRMYSTYDENQVKFYEDSSVIDGGARIRQKSFAAVSFDVDTEKQPSDGGDDENIHCENESLSQMEEYDSDRQQELPPHVQTKNSGRSRIQIPVPPFSKNSELQDEASVQSSKAMKKFFNKKRRQNRRRRKRNYSNETHPAAVANVSHSFASLSSASLSTSSSSSDSSGTISSSRRVSECDIDNVNSKNKTNVQQKDSQISISVLNNEQSNKNLLENKNELYDAYNSIMTEAETSFVYRTSSSAPFKIRIVDDNHKIQSENNEFKASRVITLQQLLELDIDFLLRLDRNKYSKTRPVQIDIQAASPNIIKLIGQKFGLHPLTIEDCSSEDTREKLEIFRKYLLVVFHSEDRILSGKDSVQNPLSLILFRRLILSFHRDLENSIESLFNRISRSSQTPLQEKHTQFSQINSIKSPLHSSPNNLLSTQATHINTSTLRSASQVCYAIIDRVIDNLIPVTEAIVSEVDVCEELSENFDSGEHNEFLHRVNLTRRNITFLRQRLQPKQNLLLNMMEPTQRKFLRDVSLPYFRDCADHIANMLNSLQIQHENLNNIQSTFLAKVSIGVAKSSNDIDQIAKSFGSLATIILPLTLVTGLFGMNITIPLQSTNPHNDKDAIFFQTLCALMLGFILLVLFVFRKRNLI